MSLSNIVKKISVFGLSSAMAIGVIACDTKKETAKELAENTGLENGYPIAPVDIRNVKVTDSFWLPIIKRVQEKTIEYAIEKCDEEGRFENFLIAGGQKEGKVRGVMPFDDSDVYKIIEGASNSLISAPNPKLEKLLDSLIGIVKVGQEKDGYLTTWRTINPAQPPATWVEVKEGKRWESLFMSHELYNAGHMYEAAAVHYKATGKRNFLDIALKNADLMVKTFGDGEDKIAAVPGHQIIETGLIKLYQITEKESYLELAKYFLDHRGDPENHELFGSYSQDSLPVVEQEEVVGHAVRAVYMYAGMTDIAALMGDQQYRNAVDKLWHNMVYKKMYVTGGIGAKHEGEAFGENYELPNLTAYNETCAAIGDVYWNNRLFNLTGDVKYYDVLERTLYNGLISGISLTGTEFFYPNALESDGTYKFNQGACTRKEWFDCSCCPTNLIRFIPAIPGLIYAKEDTTVFVNMYMSSEAEVALENQKVVLKQETAYPWNGAIKLTVTPAKQEAFTLKLRIPGWARNEVLPGGLYHYKNTVNDSYVVNVNGKTENATEEDGYIVLTKEWKKGDVVELVLPMEVREVIANNKVAEDKGKVALEYGPLVYAIEEVDNKENFDLLKINNNTQFKVSFEPTLLKGVNTIQFTTDETTFKAVPYYAWSNRGINKMKVWVEESKQ
ncbi:glycoside hydrolase family 127 protein [Neptunitalea lumnitzerae]|uniref:Glycoside hydrolase family 127 protein n=1 Tax=Neptunitalea lumnitzerae TaxID=2965509 RepID=A0ABQ5MFW0_9FLAO|nr:glycoside hydrolase family 127 protein [Neptunitalea sp. Y10]GLB48319.1 hypothetical protein Y10_06870 [Neptunitalea sp. Y10]